MPSSSWLDRRAPRRASAPARSSTSIERRRRSLGASSRIVDLERRRLVRRDARPRTASAGRAGSPPRAPRARSGTAPPASARRASRRARRRSRRAIPCSRAAVLARARRTASAEAVVAQHDRLEVEREVAQLADRRARPRRAPVEHLARLLGLAALDEVERRVEHERDAGERLHRAVVEEERDAPPLVLLGGEDLLGRARGAPGSSAASSR